MLEGGERVAGGVLRPELGTRTKDFETRRASLRRQLRELLERFAGADLLAIEAPHGPQFRGAKNTWTIKAMAEELAAVVGLAYREVNPSQWHGEVARAEVARGLKLTKADREGLTWKQRSVREASNRLGVSEVLEDEADAYWIARYVWQQATGRP